MADRPQHVGLRHIALFVHAFDETKRFYIEVLGFQVEWEPDGDNSYLTSGTDNLALHRVSATRSPRDTALDHLGLLVRTAGDVDAWIAVSAYYADVMARRLSIDRDAITGVPNPRPCE